MENYRVLFVGHRYDGRLEEIENRIEEIVRALIRTEESVKLYLTLDGEFAASAASIIKRVQSELGKSNSSLVLVLPYHDSEKEYLKKYYDEVYIPIDPNIDRDLATTKCNEWLVDNSDLLVAYVDNDLGDAYKTLKYAEEKGIPIINLATDI